MLSVNRIRLQMLQDHMESLPRMTNPVQLPALVTNLLPRLLNLSAELSGWQGLTNAWQIFNVWMETNFDPQPSDLHTFLPWYLFHWSNEDPSLEPELTRRTFAEIALRVCQDRFSEAEVHLLKVGIETPFDFYQVHEKLEGKLVLKSLLTKRVFAITTLEAHVLQPGDIVFAKICPNFEDFLIFAACSPVLPSACLPAIQELAALTHQRSTDFESRFPIFETDLLNLYYDLRHKKY